MGAGISQQQQVAKALLATSIMDIAPLCSGSILQVI
jgi:hypothetical protein